MDLPPELILEHVSRETFEKLALYQDELVLWNSSINLVASSTIDDMWDRHIIDSLQLVPFIKDASSIVDFGSGGGLPAIVVAITTECFVTMIESDRRKTEFLKHCVRKFSLKSTHVLCKRIEDIQPLNADVAISRACAPVEKLCMFMERHVREEGKGFFLKGKHVLDEITVASSYNYDYTLHRSITDGGGIVLEIQHLRKAT